MHFTDLLDRRWYGATMTQWAFAAATLGGVYVALAVLRRVLVRRLGALAVRTTTDWDDLVVEINQKAPVYVLLPKVKSELEVHLISRVKKAKLFYRTFDAWFGNKATPVNGFLEPSPKSKFEERPEFELESLHRTAMIGTPDEVIERLRRYEQLGVDEFSFWCDNSLSHDEKRKSLELFIKEVTPAFEQS